MQTENQNTGTSSPVNHPDAAEWMAFLYKETAGARRRELGAHLADCPSCSEQVRVWRARLYDLDEWKLPRSRPAARAWLPVLRWAVAASLVLAVGIWVGRSTASSAREIAALKASVAQLSDTVRRGSGDGTDTSESAAAAIAAANAETVRLLSQYSTLQENQRAADQLALKDVLDTFDVRLANLRSELETVAVNTEGGFQVTRQNLARLVSYPEVK
jgi:hypothetical protein